MRKFRGIAFAMSICNLYAASVTNGPEAGVVRFIRTANSSFDRYTHSPGPDLQEWLRSRFWRMAVYSPYFDTRLSWYPNGLVYIDAYAIYRSSALSTQHPEWILKDSAGNKLYIPWGCSNGVCPQYAGDVSNGAFRSGGSAKP